MDSRFGIIYCSRLIAQIITLCLDYQIILLIISLHCHFLLFLRHVCHDFFMFPCKGPPVHFLTGIASGRAAAPRNINIIVIVATTMIDRRSADIDIVAMSILFVTHFLF